MSPEVLQATMNLDHQGFAAADVWACGLVLWELASRCKLCDDEQSNAAPGSVVEEYKMPFEAEIIQPSFAAFLVSKILSSVLDFCQAGLLAWCVIVDKNQGLGFELSCTAQ